MLVLPFLLPPLFLSRNLYDIALFPSFPQHPNNQRSHAHDKDHDQCREHDPGCCAHSPVSNWLSNSGGLTCSAISPCRHESSGPARNACSLFAIASSSQCVITAHIAS